MVWSNPPASEGDSPPRSLELAKLQFIQQEFGDLLTGNHPIAGEGTDRIYWIHDRLFRDAWTVEAVRAALASTTRRLRVVAVTSGKGGVGKTTVSVNLALALGLAGRKTLVFDGDLGMANVHVFAGVNPRASLLDVIDRRLTLAQAITPGPQGVDFLCGASGVTRLAELDLRSVEQLGRTLVQTASGYDILLIDTGAGIGAATLHLLGLADEIVIVSTPNLAATLDAYGVIKCIHERQFGGRLHLLVNLAEEESAAEAVFTRIAGCAVKFLNRAVNRLGVLVRDPLVETANQARAPLVLNHAAHPAAQHFATMADFLTRTEAESEALPASSAA